MGKGKKVKIGYRYRLGFQLVLTQTPSDSDLFAITKIEYADREAWSGNVTTNQSVYIDKPKLLGGDKREGGVQGFVDFMFGRGDQPVNEYLAYHANRTIIPSYTDTYTEVGGWAAWKALLDSLSKQVNEDLVDNGGLPVPAYRGVVSLVFRNFMYAAMNPYMKNMAVTVRRVPRSLGTTNSTIIIDGRYNANPAHIIYDVLTNSEWGLGFESADVDTASFTAAAQTLYNEGFGLSIAWTDEGTAEDFINLILGHIGGMLNPDPSTGAYVLKLLRADYDIGTLPVFDETNISTLRSYQRASNNDLTNELTVEWFDPVNDKMAKVTAQNLATIRSVGRIVRRVVQYPGIRSAALAARVAERDLLAFSTPLAKLSIETNLEAWNLRPGMCFKFSWEKLGIVSSVFRIIEIELGNLRSGKITISAVEDVFGLPSASYLGNQAPAWEPVPNDLVDITGYKLFEMPYYSMIKYFGEDYASNMSDNRNFVVALASRSNGLWSDFEMHENVSGEYVERNQGSFSPWVTLTSSVTQLQTVIPFSGFYDLDLIVEGDLGVIDNEWVTISSIDPVAKTVTVVRGVLDSIPVTHAAGAKLYLYGDNFGIDDTDTKFATESTTYKLLPKTGDEVLPLASATGRSITLVGRQERPYPPAAVTINFSYFPTQVVDDIDINWAHRDRTQQTVDPVAWTSGSIGPEAGVTYTARIYRHSTNTLLHTQSAISGTTKTVGDAEIGDETSIRVELESVRSALTSAQTFSWNFTRVVSNDEYASRVLVDAPLAYWRLNDSGDTLRDSSPNARHGVTANTTKGVTALATLTAPNKAMTFNGTNAYGEVAYVAALAPTAALTLETWFSIPSIPGVVVATQAFVSKTQSGGYNLQIDQSNQTLDFLVRRNGAYSTGSSVPLSTLSANTTYHAVGTFDGRYARLYLNGVQVAVDDAGASYPIQYSVNNSLIIGAEAGNTTGPNASYLTGTQDEVSVYGTALTAQQVLARYRLGSNSVPAGQDPFFDKLTLLLHMNGVDASTTFTDVLAKTITANGNAQIDTAQSKFGGASGLFDGTGDYLTCPTGASFQFDGDFTVEAEIRPANTSAGTRPIFDCRSSGSSSLGFMFYQSGTSLVLAIGASAVVTSAAVVVATTWQHVAVTRRGGTIRLFHNGVVVGTYSSSANFSDGRCFIGGNNPVSAFFNGHIDDFRITKACRYARAFTPPAAAHPDVGVS